MFPGATQTDVVSVRANDGAGHRSDAQTATESVRITNNTIIVSKTAEPPALPEPGGVFTYRVRVTNWTGSPVTIDTITEAVDAGAQAAINGDDDCKVGTVITAVNSTQNWCEFTFTREFKGDAGATQSDVVRVRANGKNDAGDPAAFIDQDDETVVITDVPPTIKVDASATPASRPAPGGSFNFSVKVTNTSVESVTITSLADDVYGDLSKKGTCASGVGTALAPGATYSCEFSADISGKQAGFAQTDTVTAVAKDNENNAATDDDTATVTISGGAPTVQGRTALPTTGSNTRGLMAGVILFAGMGFILTGGEMQQTPLLATGARRRRRR